MDVKHYLTKMACEKLGSDFSRKSFRKMHALMWQNPRPSGGGRLTDRGLDIVVDTLEIKPYVVTVPDSMSYMNRTILWLEEFVDGPYHVRFTGKSRTLTVFYERTAVQLMLFDGDVNRFGTVKVKVQELEKALSTES